MYQTEELKKRSKQFAIRTVKLFRSLPRTEEARIMGKQVFLCGGELSRGLQSSLEG